MNRFFEYCELFIIALIDGIDKRFGQYLNDTIHILATISLPKFKNLEFVGTEQQSKGCFKQILIEEVHVKWIFLQLKNLKNCFYFSAL